MITRDQPFTTKYFSVYFLKNKDILSHKHSIMIKIRKLTSIQYYWLLYQPFSNFTHRPNNVFYGNKKPRSRVVLSGRASIVSFNLEQFLRLSLLFATLTF